jgi:hypothetical protein
VIDTEKDPATVGDPEMVPVPALIVRPVGSPLAAHVNGAVPVPLVTETVTPAGYAL